MEYMDIIYLIYVHKKELLTYWYYLYICVDTKSKMEYMDIIYLIYVHKKELLTYWYYLYICVDTKSKMEYMDIFINYCRQKIILERWSINY